MRFEQRLAGKQIAERLGLSPKAGSNETTKVQRLMVEGFGALILAREGRPYCPDLARILDEAAFNGENYTAALRSRIVRHFDTCTTCDNCATCARKRNELVGPYVPGLIPILLGADFHERIAEVISRAARPGVPRRRSRRGPRRLGRPALAGAAAVTVLIVAGLTVALVVGAFGSGASPVAGAAPALVYATPTSIDIRTGNGSVRTLATFPKGAPFGQFGGGRLVWSADGSKVAWLDGQLGTGGIGEFIVGRGQMRKWHCDCTSIVFQGDRLLSDDLTTENAPRLLSYPDDGSKPVPIVISGLPKSGSALANDYTLEAAVTPADVIVGYGMGVSVSGGPQLLYRVKAQGRAVLFAPSARQVTDNTAPRDFVFSPDGTRAGFLLSGLGGDALRQGQLWYQRDIRIHRSQACRVARLFLDEDPGCAGIHVGAVSSDRWSGS